MELTQYQELAHYLKETIGHEYHYIDNGIRAKAATFCAPFTIYGVCVSPDERIYVMDSSNQWHDVKDRPEDDRIILKLYKYFHLYQANNEHII